MGACTRCAVFSAHRTPHHWPSSRHFIDALLMAERWRSAPSGPLSTSSCITSARAVWMLSARSFIASRKSRLASRINTQNPRGEWNALQVFRKSPLWAMSACARENLNSARANAQRSSSVICIAGVAVSPGASPRKRSRKRFGTLCLALQAETVRLSTDNRRANSASVSAPSASFRSDMYRSINWSRLSTKPP